MNSTSKFIAVYGATGHTGRFVVQEAQRRGLPVVAVGRSAARLAEALPPIVPQRTADLDDPASLERAFAGCAVVINCAGPFLDTAAAVAQAALRAGCHYIDVTAEQASALASFTELDAPARAAGRAVIPAAAFYGGLADLLASALAAEGDIDEITVAIALDRWWPTSGTRKTGERNTVPRVVVRDGRLAPLQPSADVANWVFSAPLGPQAMTQMPFSEVITLSRHLKAREIRSLLNRSALADIRDAATPAPTAADDSGRSAQRFELVVRLVQHGITRTAGVRGQDIYAVTAPVVIEAAQRLMAPAYRRSGALALGEAVDAVDMLRSLDGSALEVFGDASPG
ncbi:saccharopine dehydrogenase NADP-binding domain-containing protein [Ideonella sp. BN130291]|uniref:saccharopine dehydrogenase NADP-binding domain-containing protein n=1 Tax=Ideonella sp. BN130291 TaxID=3112940 RepID=UPI002E27095F|nr:saccharopine dehydrogenase NADP-binding domain-containing protein [Ideonella sp. BN130291]